jgi:hypothetical protein
MSMVEPFLTPSQTSFTRYTEVFLASSPEPGSQTSYQRHDECPVAPIPRAREQDEPPKGWGVPCRAQSPIKGARLVTEDMPSALSCPYKVNIKICCN